ncbi:protein kinase [Acidobacteriota bacterium]
MTVECPKCQTDNPDESKFCNECSTPLSGIREAIHTKTLETPVEELTTGSTFADRYQIIEEIGKGGMGRVYKVLDKETNEKIALKLIKSDIAADKKTVERFRNELTIARKIVQKNVCRMFDLGREKNSYYITMEYIAGQDLRDLIRQTGLLTVGKAVSIAKQICDGLTEAHNLGVVHRDLKPNNIMIDKGGNAKIMDFGIARAIKGKSITGSGVVIGTPQYMSPEQVEGKEVDQQSDIYSLGIILYEMLTTRVPFEGDTPLTIGVKQKTEAPKNPREFNDRIPDDLNRLILKCLEKDKENRYQSAEDVKSDLEKLEQGLPSTDRVVPKKKPLTSRELTVQLNLKKLFIPTLAVVAIVIIGLFFWSPWSKKGPVFIQTDKPTLAIVYFENNTGDENMEIWRNTFANLLIDDLSQSRILNVLSGDRLLTVLQRLNLLDAKSFSSEDLENIAAHAGVQNILSGRMDRAGDTVIISTRLHNMDTGEQPKPRRIDTKGEEDFIDAVNQLTRLIKTDLNLNAQAIVDDIDKDVGTITSEYPEALRNYYEGYRYHLMQDDERSIPFLKEAIRIDPEFAMAYRCLAVKGLPLKQKREYIQKALDFSDKVSEGERLWIQANYYNINGDLEKSTEAFKRLYEFNSGPVALSTIARNYQDLGDWEKAIEYFEATRNERDEWRGTYENLGYLYEAKGMYKKAREVYTDYFNNIRADPYMQGLIADTYAREGQFELAIQEADKAIALNPNSYTKSGIYHLQGDFEETERLLRKQLEDERINWKMNGWVWLEILYRTLGQYEKAREEAQAGLDYAEENNLIGWKRGFNGLLSYHDLEAGNLDKVLERAEFIWESAIEAELPGQQADALWWRIQVYLRMGNIEEARVLAEEANKILTDTPNIKDDRWYLDDLGLIEMKRKNYSRAIDLFTRVYEMQGGQRSWLDQHAYILSNLASAYFLNGDLEAAQREYENILALTTGRLQWGDLYVKSYYQLGKIHEELDNRSKAIEHYEKFLDLWNDADPGLPEVDDARERLVGLKQ